MPVQIAIDMQVLCLLYATLLACSSKLLLYIVVSQDVVIVAVVLEMYTCVCRDQQFNVACFSHQGISTYEL